MYIIYRLLVKLITHRFVTVFFGDVLSRLLELNLQHCARTHSFCSILCAIMVSFQDSPSNMPLHVQYASAIKVPYKSIALWG